MQMPVYMTFIGEPKLSFKASKVEKLSLKIKEKAIAVLALILMVNMDTAVRRSHILQSQDSQRKTRKYQGKKQLTWATKVLTNK